MEGRIRYSVAVLRCKWCLKRLSPGHGGLEVPLSIGILSNSVLWKGKGAPPDPQYMLIKASLNECLNIKHVPCRDVAIADIKIYVVFVALNCFLRVQINRMVGRPSYIRINMAEGPTG